MCVCVCVCVCVSLLWSTAAQVTRPFRTRDMSGGQILLTPPPCQENLVHSTAPMHSRRRQRCA